MRNYVFKIITQVAANNQEIANRKLLKKLKDSPHVKFMSINCEGSHKGAKIYKQGNVR